MKLVWPDDLFLAVGTVLLALALWNFFKRIRAEEWLQKLQQEVPSLKGRQGELDKKLKPSKRKVLILGVLGLLSWMIYVLLAGG